MRGAVRASLLTVLMFLLPNGSAMAAARVSVLISDLHFGLGKESNGRWHPYEDFRWPNALEGFLQALSSEYGDNIDLVIVGDFLELWQTPADIPCSSGSADAGCTVGEMTRLAARISKAHVHELSLLGDFARRGDNHLYVIPGNHDAALLVPQVWQQVYPAFGDTRGRAQLVTSGIWQSADKHVVAEHGHQIGSDVNSFAKWPSVTTRGNDGIRFMVRPWGERFVQQLFNTEERAYPVIDNLSPETAGARYRMHERGWLGTLADTARFIAFNIFETSLTQKADGLGKQDPGQDNFSRKAAERAGHQLFLLSLPAKDPLRELIEGVDEQQVAMRNQLDTLVTQLSDDDLNTLCRTAARQSNANPCTDSLGALLTNALVPQMSIFRSHLANRQRELGGFDIFVYGHTHLWEYPWKVTNVAGEVRNITVVNTGAFQRLVDDAGFVKIAKDKSISPAQALKQLSVEDLQPCYGLVVVDHGAAVVRARLRLWQMQEGGNQGVFREPGVSDCPRNGPDK
ncbi:UDP-2,3-diacylglucosamine pyrophosphatase LpxH [Pseudomonas sp. TE6288]|uniref:metallophosphoesterase n=1 Tax=Pseudomonas hunanensis TaxID=1247546 RepID=UPI002406E338|nr:metallophosphoesterase [Pseudomonas hunanensis]MDF9757587.1 UDP-2,3-diacylglucosamine pyrophosphatase LpxH [Pseudomonas hunanensis]